MIPIGAATQAGVLVANVPGANARSVAEHVMRSLLQLARRSAPVSVVLRGRSAHWNAARALADAGRELSGSTLGIVGYGHIGQAVARIAAGGFGMRVFAHVRSPRLPEDAIAERADSLDALLAQSDALVLACPLTPETRGLIDARRLAALKPGALLVNVARGPVIVTDALVDALRAGTLGGAALDVYDSVPLPDDHPLWTLADAGANLLLTPHVAGISDDSMRAMGEGVVAAAASLLRGEVPANCINPEAVPAFHARLHAAH
jgi:D-3-phosphoglycerate dehydrogenase